jgi:RNA polymerase sigma-70 factor, ECF subfamily
MSDPNGYLNFDADVLPHIGAAYNLARWLTRSEQDAEDVVQEVFLRAFRFFDGFCGGNTRTWLLRIVRNTSYTWLERNRSQQPTAAFEQSVFSSNTSANPKEELLRSEDGKQVRFALEALPPRLREILILREVEGMSYEEISEVTSIPPESVMSRLSRARGELQASLANLAHAKAIAKSAERSGHTRFQWEESSSSGELPWQE